MNFTFDFHPITFAATYLLISSLCYFIIYKKKQNSSLVDLAVMLSLILYCLIIFKLVLLPIQVFSKVNLSLSPSLYWQLVPFESIQDVIRAGTWKTQLLGNIGTFFPIPFFISYYKNNICKIKTAILSGVFISLGIEITQVIINYITKFPNRVFDVDDILLNVIGTIFGWISLQILSKIIKGTKRKSQSLQ